MNEPGSTRYLIRHSGSELERNSQHAKAHQLEWARAQKRSEKKIIIRVNLVVALALSRAFDLRALVSDVPISSTGVKSLT